MLGIAEVASLSKTVLDILRTILTSIRDGTSRPKPSDIEAIIALKQAIFELSRATHALLAVDADHRTLDRPEWTSWQMMVCNIISRADALPLHPLAASEPKLVERMGAMFIDDFQAAPREVEGMLLKVLSPSGRATANVRAQLKRLAQKWNLALPAYSIDHDHENSLRHLATMLEGTTDQIDSILKRYWKPSS